MHFNAFYQNCTSFIGFITNNFSDKFFNIFISYYCHGFILILDFKTVFTLAIFTLISQILWVSFRPLIAFFIFKLYNSFFNFFLSLISSLIVFSFNCLM